MYERGDPAVLHTFASEILADQVHALSGVGIGIDEDPMRVLIASPKNIGVCKVIRSRFH
jgi:hypothetical protein